MSRFPLEGRRDVKATILAARKNYDRTADGYAAADSSSQGHVFAAVLRRLCAQRRPLNVLDLGVGTGRYFQAVSGGGTFVGVDVSEGMLAHAHGRREVLLQNGFKDVWLLCADALMSPRLLKVRFDLVYSIGLFGYHLPLDNSVMKTVSEILTPTGAFFVTTVQQPLTVRVRSALRRRLVTLGVGVGPTLGSHACPPHRYRRLATTAGMVVSETFVFDDAPRWNDLPQCGAVFALEP